MNPTACIPGREDGAVAKLSREARMSSKVLTDKGVSNRDAARLLGVSEGCVRYHRRRQAAGAVDGRSREVRHTGIRQVTPNERHRDEDDAILAPGKAVYEAARARHRARWTGATRSWRKVEAVYLNPGDPI